MWCALKTAAPSSIQINPRNRKPASARLVPSTDAHDDALMSLAFVRKLRCGVVSSFLEILKKLRA